MYMHLFLDSAASGKKHSRVFGLVGDAFEHCFVSVLLQVSRKIINSTINFQLLPAIDPKMTIFTGLYLSSSCEHGAVTNTVVVNDQSEYAPVARSLCKPMFRRKNFYGNLAVEESHTFHRLQSICCMRR